MRIKRGQNKKAKHKKVLKQAKGYRLSYSKLYRRAKEATGHAGSYNYAHRLRRRSQKKQEWVKTISAELYNHNISYSKFSKMLNDKKIMIDKKNIAQMIVDRPEHFKMLIETASK